MVAILLHDFPWVSFWSPHDFFPTIEQKWPTPTNIFSDGQKFQMYWTIHKEYRDTKKQQVNVLSSG